MFGDGICALIIYFFIIFTFFLPTAKGICVSFVLPQDAELAQTLWPIITNDDVDGDDVADGGRFQFSRRRAFRRQRKRLLRRMSGEHPPTD